MSPGPPKKFDREEVLDRALRVFWRQGYEGTGMSELLEQMGIGRQSLYDTFGDKRTLFLEALRRYFRMHLGPMVAQLRAPGSPVGNIKKVFGMWETMARDGAGPDCHCGCLAGNTVAEFGESDPEVSAMIRANLEVLEKHFKQTLDRAREAGELTSPLSTTDLARTLVNMAQGLALFSKLGLEPARTRSVFRVMTAVLEGG